MLRPFGKFKPLKPAEGYGRYEFDDLDEVVGSYVAAILERDGAVAIEPKWDGIRLVIHCEGGKVGAFTEDRQRDRAEILPTLVQSILEAFGNHSVILDGELLLGREDGGEFIPIMRPDMMKVVVGKEPITDPIRFVVFDLLYFDGEDYTGVELRERRKALERVFEGISDTGVLQLTPQRIVTSLDEAEEAIEWAVQVTGSEGAMIKSLTSVYELDGRTTEWAKYKRWKALKCLIIGISKVFPPKINPEDWKTEFRRSTTYIFRCAVLGPDGKTLIPIESKRVLTESDLQLRYVNAGEEDPVTGNIATKSEWRGRDDPRLWQMDERFGHRQPGEFAYGQTYAIKVDGEVKLGQVIEVAPISLGWFADDDGFVHLTWMHPRVLRVGIDDPSEVTSWERITELIAASGFEVPEVEVVDGKLKLKTANGVAELKSALHSFSVAINAKSDDDEEEDESIELGTPERPLPRLFYHTQGVGLTRKIAQAAAKCIPEHKIYVELFAGTSPLLRAKPKELSEREIIVDIDPDVIAFLKAIKSGRWVDWKRYDWRPSKERFAELRSALLNGELSGNKRTFAWVYTIFYGAAGYCGRHGVNPFFFNSEDGYNWRYEVELFFNRCALWEARLQGVKIKRMDALEALQEFDSPDTFFFADPPWEFETSEHFYIHSDFDHDRFRRLCSSIKGKILVLSLPGKLSEWRDKGFHIRRLTVETSKFSFMPVAKEHGKSSGKLLAQRRIYFVTNYEIPKLSKLVSGANLFEEDELTHEEQRLEEERRLGDSWKVRHDVAKFPDGYKAVYMRHYRGLWSPSEAEQVNSLLDELIRAKDGDRRAEIWKVITKEFNAVALLEDIETVMELAQEASDKREDVSKLLESFTTDDLNEILERVSRLSELRDRVVNFASVHGDLRIQNPQSPETQLIGLTLMTPAVAVQFPDGEIVAVLRDKFLQWQEGDRIVTVKKARQPIVWYDVVNPKEPLMWSPPQASGSTKNTWAMFEWQLFLRVWFGIQRPDYHEIFVQIEEAADRFTTPEGKWVLRLLEGTGKKVGGDGLYWQFWYPERDGQIPYILSKTVGQARKEWEGRDYEYIVVNHEVIPIVIEQFPDLKRKVQSKRKAKERLERIGDWAALERGTEA